MYPRLPARHVILPGTGCAPPMRSNAPAGHCPACTTATASWNVTGWPHQPPGSAATQQPRPYSVVAPGHRRWRSDGCGAPCRCRQGRSGRAESGRAPPCMRWRGPARPRRTGWSVAWPCRRARRPPGPGTRARDRSPGSSHAPGVAPQVVPVSSGKAFLLPTRAPRKSLRAAISGSSAIHEAIHRKRPVIRISRRLSTVLFTAYPQPGTAAAFGAVSWAKVPGVADVILLRDG